MKTYHFEIYNSRGRLLSNRWENAKFIGFDKIINGGFGPCIIELGEDFKWANESLYLNNEVQIWIEDKDTGNDGKLIYRGYISNYARILEEHSEKIIVYLLGYYTKLTQDIWKSGATTTFDYSIIGATDIGTIFRGLLDRYIAETANPKLNYSKDSISLTSTTTEFKFEMLTYREGIDMLRQLAPTDWFWRVDENGTVWLKSKPTDPTHRFTLGRHFSKVRIERSTEKIKNALLFYDDASNLLKLYTDDGSILDYDRRVTKVMNDRIGVSTDADKIAEAFIAEHKDPDVKVIAEIVDNNEDDELGYDIESINPGDTCVFEGFDESVGDILKYNMLITHVEYTLDKAIITIEPLSAGVIARSENINERVDAIEREGVPTSYTT